MIKVLKDLMQKQKTKPNIPTPMHRATTVDEQY